MTAWERALTWDGLLHEPLLVDCSVRWELTSFSVRRVGFALAVHQQLHLCGCEPSPLVGNHQSLLLDGSLEAVDLVNELIGPGWARVVGLEAGRLGRTF